MYPETPVRLRRDMDWDAEEVSAPSHPSNLFLLDYWESKRRNGAAPLRADINPVDLRSILGGIYIAEPAGPDEFRYRLTGSDVESRTGRAFTGSLVSDVFTPRRAADTVAIYKRVIACNGPVTMSGSFTGTGIEHIRFESVMLPLSFGKDGAGIIGGQFAFN